jgi:hypothetical protein
MQAWVDIWDANYTQRVGNRLRPIMASYKRKLDEAGMGRATFAIDPRALSIIQVRRIAEVWLSDTKLEWDSGGTSFEKVPYSRMIGAFVIEDVSPSPKERTITIRGAGVMSKLIDTIALPGLAFENQTVATVLSELAALAGWTVDADAALSSQFISLRFAGENVLRALAAVVESQGIHMRESSTVQELQAGAFGDVNSHAEYMKGDGGESAFRKDAPMMIRSADIRESSSDVVNKVYVYGGGDGDAALTMALSDRSFVDSETANGRTHYFIANGASMSAYGVIERRLDIKRISPTSPSDAAEVYGANALADGGKAWLDRNAFPYELLKLQVQNVNETIAPGDKVHVTYKEVINLLGVPYQERDIDEPYWIMAVEESISSQGLEVALEVANLDRYERNASDIVVGMVDSINVQNINIQPYPAPYYWSAPAAPIDTVTPYSIQFAVNQQAVRLNQAIAYIFRRSWTAISGIAEAGGDHNHRVATTAGTNVALEGMFGRVMNAKRLDGTSHSLVIPNASNDDIYTEGNSGTHTHDFTFSSVQTDDAENLLEDVMLKIDGNVIAAGLFPDGSTDDYAEVDITDALKAGTLRGFHEAEVSCASGRGDIYMIFFIDIDVSRVRS